MDIKHIILKSIYGQLTDDEQQFLDSWKAQEDNARLYTHLRTNIINKRAVEYLAAIDVEHALRNVKKEEITLHHPSPTTHHLSLNALLRVAAIAVLLLVGGAFWYHREYTRVTPPEISEQVQTAMLQSEQTGRNAADVEACRISQNATGEVWSTPSSTTHHPSSTTYSPSPNTHHLSPQSDAVKELLAARRITTRSDKEYWVTLSDGTLVHLNYNTRMIYPEKFQGDTRDVILEGEAYFMVARDKSRPFIVHTPQGDVKVYGTEFNVNTRSVPRSPKNEENRGGAGLSVVLVRGSVGVTPLGGAEQMIQPGEQFSVFDSHSSIEAVDTAPYVAWNEGTFVFHNQPLAKIMLVLSRWYGRSVEYGASDISQLYISGAISKYNDIGDAIAAVEAVTGLQITVTDKRIMINH